MLTRKLDSSNGEKNIGCSEPLKSELAIAI